MDSIRDDVLQHYRDKVSEDRRRPRRAPGLTSIAGTVPLISSMQNVKILESDCKCTTDFDKSLVYLRRLEDLGAGHRPESDYLKGCYECSRSMHRAPMDSSALHEGKRYDIAVLCSTAGRLDQMIGTLNSLTTLEPERRAYLIMGSNIVFLLKGGEHTIIHTSPIEGPHCGLVPLSQEPLRVRTQGLVWDIRGDTEMGFGSLISTNNLLDLERSGAETNGSRSRALCAVGKVQLSTTGNVVWMVSFDYSKIGLLKAGRRGSVGG